MGRKLTTDNKVKILLGIFRVELYFRGCRSLKERRGYLRSFRDRLGNIGFAVAQVGPADLLQRAWLAASCISGSGAGVSRMLDHALMLLNNPGREVVDLRKEIIEVDESLEMEDFN